MNRDADRNIHRDRHIDTERIIGRDSNTDIDRICRHKIKQTNTAAIDTYRMTEVGATDMD